MLQMRFWHEISFKAVKTDLTPEDLRQTSMNTTNNVRYKNIGTTAVRSTVGEVCVF